MFSFFFRFRADPFLFFFFAAQVKSQVAIANAPRPGSGRTRVGGLASGGLAYVGSIARPGFRDLENKFLLLGQPKAFRFEAAGNMQHRSQKKAQGQVQRRYCEDIESPYPAGQD